MTECPQSAVFILDTEDALLRTFRPKDRGVVETGAAALGRPFPIILRDYFAWRQPAGSYVYLVFATADGVPTGIVFESNGGGAAAVPQMCDWCHSPGLGSRVALLTARVNAAKRVGVHLCSDLSCKQKLEEEANRTGRSMAGPLERLVTRMGRFAAEALSIDLSGAGR